jgi:hypothetical protein
VAVNRVADLVLLDAEWIPQLTIVQGRVAYRSPVAERAAS